MGRFETSAAFYGYREPYPDEFFATLAMKVGFQNRSKLLDVGCGPGNLAIGFARLFPNSEITGIDIEPAMLDEARVRAKAAGVNITFLQKAIQHVDFAPNSFALATVGRALHWLPRQETLAVLERVLVNEANVVICGTKFADALANPWEEEYRRVRRAFADDPDETRYRIDSAEWFRGSGFRLSAEVLVPYRHLVTIHNLQMRALSFSNTSPAVLGERRSKFESAIEAALSPFAQNGLIEEDLQIVATIFERTPSL